jgi:hypothetical protein
MALQGRPISVLRDQGGCPQEVLDHDGTREDQLPDPDLNPDDFDPSLADLFVDTDEVLDVTSLTNSDLLDKYFDCDDKLLALREVRFPRTDRGREIHSLRAALRVEMLHRRLT